MKNKLVLIGGGGHCKSVLDSILNNNLYDEIVITDNNLIAGTDIMGCQVVGTDEILSKLFKIGFENAFITVGSVKSTKIRHILYKKAKNIGFKIVNIIDSSAYVSSFAKLGTGIFIGKNAVINADTSVANMSIINTCAVIEHECTIGEYVHISVGAKLCGNVKIGNDSFIGAQSVIIQGREIGKNVIVGAGSTVISNVKNNLTVYGTVK